MLLFVLDFVPIIFLKRFIFLGTARSTVMTRVEF